MRHLFFNLFNNLVGSYIHYTNFVQSCCMYKQNAALAVVENYRIHFEKVAKTRMSEKYFTTSSYQAKDQITRMTNKTAGTWSRPNFTRFLQKLFE